MDATYYQTVKHQYENGGADSTELFRTMISIAKEIGWHDALECLHQCVTEKRLAWIDKNVQTLERSGNPLMDGYKIFYESYLGLSIPRDGEIVEATRTQWVTRWWNHCPTLVACQKLGLDTREVCRQVYEQPVQVLLARIDPRLRFKRNYTALRPFAPYCEEIIELEDQD
jgi:hypothetical protein